MSKRTERDRRDLMTAAKRIEEDIRIIDEKNRIFEAEKEEIVKRYNEVENEKTLINSEKLKIEQARTELRLRLQSVDVRY